MKAPVLLIAWRRPHTTRQVIEAIRAYAPSRLYIACDGPSPDRADAAEKVAATRAILEREIDWPCQVERLYSNGNQGCRLGVSRAITWFFDNEEEGIILEDDCVPHRDFFGFCETLLDRYRDDPRVWCISGDNFQNGHWRGDGCYYFSLYAHIWGWASWRRCWRHYDSLLSGWPLFRDSGRMASLFADVNEREYWHGIWQQVYEQKIDTWDYQWMFMCASNGGLTALPNRNLVRNIGFGPESTHTLTEAEPIPNELGLPRFDPPQFMLRDQEADTYFFYSYLRSDLSHKPSLNPAESPLSAVARKFLRRGRNWLRQLRPHQSPPPPGPELLTVEGRERLSQLPRHQPGTIQACGGLLHYGDACTVLAGEAEIFRDLVYEFRSQRDHPIIVDCGANIGLATLWFAQRFPTSTILAYEADPDIFRCLQSNIQSFDLTADVKAFQRAIWKDDHGIDFHQEGGFSGQVSLHSHELVKSTVHVPSITINQILAEQAYVDLLKIDIEGAECHVLDDAVDLARVDRVFLEYHSHESDPQVLDRILHVLTAKGFRYHIREANPSPHPFVQVKPMLGMDLQLNIYAYRPLQGQL